MIRPTYSLEKTVADRLLPKGSILGLLEQCNCHKDTLSNAFIALSICIAELNPKLDVRIITLCTIMSFVRHSCPSRI